MAFFLRLVFPCSLLIDYLFIVELLYITCSALFSHSPDQLHAGQTPVLPQFNLEVGGIDVSTAFSLVCEMDQPVNRKINFVHDAKIYGTT